MTTKKLNILLVFGTRPEVIKMAPVVKEFRKYPAHFNCKVCVTGQHRQMIDPLLKLFGIKVEYDLNLMRKNQTLDHITTTVLREIGGILEKEKTDYLVVQGDTTTAMAAAMAAFYKNVRVAHVEAGLRTFNKQHPFPEEVNRCIIDSMSDLYFAHTSSAKRNLIKEGVTPGKIEITGNTVIDALMETARKKFNFRGTPWERAIAKGRKLILMTAHRRENFGRPIEEICQAVKEIAQRYSQEVTFVYPVHLNPNIQKPVYSILEKVRNVILCDPMEYLPMVQLMKRSFFVLTDSGGLQEEAPSLGKPVLVLRKTTERPEGVKAGCVEVVGTDFLSIVKKTSALLENKKKYQRMAQAKNPYGDGTASKKIVARMLQEQYKAAP